MKQPVRSVCLIHLLLYFTSIGGGPVRPSSPLCAIHFEAGSIYHYQYVTDLSMNKAQKQSHDTAKNPVGFQVVADLKLSVVWKKSYDYLMRLEVTKSSIESASRAGITSEFKELRRYPVFFHWHGDGTVSRVYLPMNERTISANLKKGIISMLQLQTVGGERTEVDASGECDVEYTVIGNKVTKKKTGCKNLEKTGQYHQSREIFDSSQDSVITSTYEFANDVITHAESVDTRTFTLNADKSVNLATQSRQTLKLKETKDGAKTVKGSSIDDAVEAVDPHSKLDLIGMLLGTDIDSPTCLIDCISLKDTVEQLREDLLDERVAQVESSQAFSKLVPVFRQASKDKIVEVMKWNEDILAQLLDLAAAAQTDSAIEAAMEVLDFTSATAYQLPEKFILATSFSTHPRESLLRALLKLFQTDLASKELSESVALALGAVTRTFCRFDEQCSLPVVKEIETAMLTGLSNSADTALTLRIVRALRNAGLQATKEKLIEIAESSKETALTVAAIQALASINKDYPTKNVFESMNRIYHQRGREYDSAARSAALSIILSSNPSVPEVRNLIISTINQTDHHLATFVLATLRDLSASNPSFQKTFYAALKDMRLKNYNTWSPGGKANALTSYLGRSQFTDVEYQLFMQNAQTGIMKKSGMQVNLQSAADRHPLLLFSIYAQGLESFVDSSAVPEGVEPDDPTAGLALDVLDVLLRPIEFFRGSSELMSAVWNAPSEPVTALAMNVLTQDKKQNIYLQNGIVLEHQLTGAASIQLSGFISISLWNQDAHSVIRNSGALAVLGGLNVANNNHLSAAVTFDLSGAAHVDFSTDVNFYVNPPKLCLRMSLNPFTVSESWLKSERARGLSKKVQYTSSQQHPVQGISYVLSKENSQQCTKLLEQ